MSLNNIVNTRTEVLFFWLLSTGYNRICHTDNEISIQVSSHLINILIIILGRRKGLYGYTSTTRMLFDIHSMAL